MKNPCPRRRALALVLSLCLVSTLIPFAFADNSEPQTTTGDAVEVIPSENDGTTEDAAEITTGPAANPVPYSGTNDAVLNGTVLTITWNDDTHIANESIRNNEMYNLINNAFSNDIEANWPQITAIKLVGDATALTGFNWEYLRAMCFYKYYNTGEPYSRLSNDEHDPNYNVYNGNPYRESGMEFARETDKLTKLDLSGMTLLTTISARPQSEISSIEAVLGDDPAQATASQAIDPKNVLPQANAREVVLPASLTNLGDYAFACCAVKELNLPASPSSIGFGAFLDCQGVKEANFVNCEIPRISDYAFKDCTSLTTVDLEDCGNLISIGYRAFWECDNLEEVSLKDCSRLESIQDSAFLGCGKLGTFDLTGCYMLGSIGDSVFAYCNNFTPINLSDCINLQFIEVSAFWECTSLTSLDLSHCSKLESIGASAFFSCDKLKSVDLSNCTSLTSIGDYAFQTCLSLTNVILPKELENLGTNVFTSSTYPMTLQNVYFTGDIAPQLVDRNGGSVSPVDVFPSGAGNGGDVVVFVPEDGVGYGADEWKQLGDKLVPYPRTAQDKVTWSKPGQDGNPPAYEVWDTIQFTANPLPIDQVADPKVGECAAEHFTGDWRLLASSPTTGEAVTVAGNSVAPGTSVSGVVYPSRRDSGVYTLWLKCDERQIFAGLSHGWRPLPKPENPATRQMNEGYCENLVELKPPPTPAEASWLLTVENGTGGGYYEAEQSAPVVAQLKAEPPTPDAKFLRWELVSGTGTFADANAPETRFTMAVGDSTVRAVFDTGAVIVTPNPLITPTPTPSPPTGDQNAWPLGAGLLLAGMAAAASQIRRGILTGAKKNHGPSKIWRNPRF